MAERLRLPDEPEADRELERYFEALLALWLLARYGHITEAQFRTEVVELTDEALELLYRLAGGERGNARAAREIAERLATAQQSAVKLARDVFDGRYSPSQKKTAAEGETELRNRLTLWTFGIGAAYWLGKVYRRQRAGQPRPRLQWRLGATERHCSTCAGLHMQIATPEEWQRQPHRPQGRSLECGGYRCDCGLYEVTG